MKVLVTGANGQLGKELAATVGNGVELIAMDRAALDISDAEAVEQALAASAAQLVINAAAYTAVDRAESEPELAQLGNVQGPAQLARACARHNARLIHISTDFVFAGDSATPYHPDAPTAPLGEYGRSKLAGEQAVRDALPGALVIRTGWVYSRHGGNFVKTMLRLMSERDELAVVADQVGTPTWARSLAQACWSAAENSALEGTLHWSDAGVCSWYDFAVAIFEEASALGMLDRGVSIRPIETRDYPTPARRPAYSVLDKTEAWNSLALQGVHWRQQLRSMLQDMQLQDSATPQPGAINHG